MAILVRTNNQAAVIAEAMKSAGIPVKTTRPPAGISAAIALAAENTSRHTLAAWASDTIEESLEDSERAVAGLVKTFLAEDHPGVIDGRAFSAWAATNANTLAVSGGVEILTFHAAKGREWNFVVVAGAESGLLPHASAKTAQQKSEETRLAYVALTRASEQLVVTWAHSRNGRKSTRSHLIENLPLGSKPKPVSPPARETVTVAGPSEELREALIAWRTIRAKALFMPPTSICSDEELQLVLQNLPRTEADVAEIFGSITSLKVADDIINLVNDSLPARN